MNTVHEKDHDTRCSEWQDFDPTHFDPTHLRVRLASWVVERVRYVPDQEESVVVEEKYPLSIQHAKEWPERLSKCLASIATRQPVGLHTAACIARHADSMNSHSVSALVRSGQDKFLRGIMRYEGQNFDSYPIGMIRVKPFTVALAADEPAPRPTYDYDTAAVTDGTPVHHRIYWGTHSLDRRFR